jgi:hypothetical protein
MSGDSSSALSKSVMLGALAAVGIGMGAYYFYSQRSQGPVASPSFSASTSASAAPKPSPTAAATAGEDVPEDLPPLVEDGAGAAGASAVPSLTRDEAALLRALEANKSAAAASAAAPPPSSSSTSAAPGPSTSSASKYDLPYAWNQSPEEVMITTVVDADVKSKDVKCSLLSRKIRVAVRGEVVLEGPLTRPIIPDESNWQLDTGKNGVKRLSIVLQKVRGGGVSATRPSVLNYST